MRKNIFSLLAIVVLILVSKSCEKNETPIEEEITSADIDAIKSAVMSGDWIITYYFDTDKEETSDFEGYTFKFNGDGTLATTNGSSSLSGAWSISTLDNSSSSDVDFNILFSSPEIFEEISDDWDIKKYTITKIELLDISGGDGGTDLLTFEKL